MDCEAFQNSEIDALYGELDAAAMAAMSEHAATCAACNARLERLRSTRGLVLSVAVEDVPSDFEARIMAAVDGHMATRRRGPALVPPGVHVLASPSAPMGAPGAPGAPNAQGAPPEVKAEGGAKIFKFMARPAFGVAATFILVIFAAAILMQNGMSKSSPFASNDESAPAAVAAAASGPSGMDPGAVPPVAMPTAMASAVAMQDQGALLEAQKNAPAEPRAGGAPAAAAPMAPPPSMAKAVATTKPASPADAKAFAAAKALYTQGRYSEALPKFEALKASNPEADLYAARCIAKTRGCAAATARFDDAAKSNAGTEIGSRAEIEGARCYQATGDTLAARKRLESAKDDGILTGEATTELDALDRKAGPGTPGGAGHAAPKRPAPLPMTNERVK